MSHTPKDILQFILGLTQNSPALLSCLAVQVVLSSSGRLAGSILRKSYIQRGLARLGAGLCFFVWSAAAFSLQATIQCPNLDDLSSCVVSPIGNLDSPSESFSTEGIAEILESINDCKDQNQQDSITCQTRAGVSFSCSRLNDQTATCQLPDQTAINCESLSDTEASCQIQSDDTLKDRLIENIQTPSWRQIAIVLATICPTRALGAELQAECDRLISRALSGESISDLLNQITPLGAGSSIDATQFADQAHQRYIQKRMASIREKHHQHDHSSATTSRLMSQLQALSLQATPEVTLDTQPLYRRVGSFFNGAVLSGDKAHSTLELGSDWTTASFTGGLDYRYSDAFLYGIALGYQQTEMDLIQNRYQIDQAGYSASLYASWTHTMGFYLESILSYSGYRFEQDRNIRYQLGDLTVDQLADSRYFSDKTSLNFTAGIEKSLDATSITGYFSAQANQSIVERYNENIQSDNNNSGSGWALHYNEQNQRSNRLTLGTQVSYAIAQSWGVLQPSVRLEFVHELETDRREISGYFLGNTINPLGFSLETNAIDPTYIQSGIGTSMVFTQNQSAFIFLESLLGHDTFNQTYINAGWRWEI